MKRILTHIIVAFMGFTVGVLANFVISRPAGYMKKVVNIPSQMLAIPVPTPRVEEHGFIMVIDEKTGMRHCIHF